MNDDNQSGTYSTEDSTDKAREIRIKRLWTENLEFTEGMTSGYSYGIQKLSAKVESAGRNRKPVARKSRQGVLDGEFYFWS